MARQGLSGCYASFWLAISPKVFNALADALQWCFCYRGDTLDDFMTMVLSASSTCARKLRVIQEVVVTLGVPLAEDKCEGSLPMLTFLGIEIDTQERVLRLPQKKLLRVKTILTQWRKNLWCRRRELESLVCLLHHSAKVVALGWSLLLRMIALLKGIHQRNHHIRLNKEFRADLQWWLTFMETWNGVSVLPLPHSSAHIVSDAPEASMPFVTTNGFSCGGLHAGKTNIFHLRN